MPTVQRNDTDSMVFALPRLNRLRPIRILSRFLSLAQLYTAYVLKSR